MDSKYCHNSTKQNVGYSSGLMYDEQAYKDKLQESTDPLQYRLFTNSRYNCNSCLTTLGPRSGHMGYGVSLPVDSQVAVAQSPEMVNIESILSNRNVRTSKQKTQQLNPINVTQFKTKNLRACNDYLNPEASRLSYPPAVYRDVGMNRFYDLPKNPQANIFWDFAENTTLNAKDNFFPEIPKLWSPYVSLPHEQAGKPKCNNITACPIPQ